MILSFSSNLNSLTWKNLERKLFTMEIVLSENRIGHKMSRFFLATERKLAVTFYGPFAPTGNHLANVSLAYLFLWSSFNVISP